jgi:Ca-activated chloride channel family protein
MPRNILPGFFARLLFAVTLLVGTGAHASSPDGETGDKTESPYFFVNSDNPEVDRLPLKDTHVDVRIIGVIADVTVTQRYKNEGSRPIEARYVFPGSTRAAVYGMQVLLQDRVLKAEIREKQQARIEYDNAKREGKTAALLEQHRENVFQMQVANIMPGDDVRVELHYTEVILPTEAKYQFVFPTVVGPRYNGLPANGSGTNEKWLSMPFLREGQPSTAGFDISIQLTTPMPAQAISSPSHKIEAENISSTETRIILAHTGRHENNRDFILDYRLSGDHIESGILLSQGGKDSGGENFFLAMVEPPRSVDLKQIVPREYVFIVDISGSMHGFPLDTAKVLLQDLVGGLRASDSFNIMLFAGSKQTLAPQSVPATRANIEQGLEMLRRQSGGGGTELVPALRAALAMKSDPDRARTFVVVTDGYVSVERETFELISKNLSQANLFAFGIGSSVNRQLIEGMARAGRGEPFVVLSDSNAQQEAERFRKMIDAPVLTHIQARFEGLDVYDIEPQSVPDVFARRPIILFGKWRGAPKGRLILEGRTAAGMFKTELPVKDGQVSAKHSALRYLWARQRVAQLNDQETLEGGSAYRTKILDLGLRYNLLTSYTSFIAVDHIVRNRTPDDGTSVDQPSPLPEGVSELAVGANVPSTPEPGLYWMMAIAGISLLLALRRRQVKA